MSDTTLPDRWRREAALLEAEKRKVRWASEKYLSHCAVQATLERCADELEATIARSTDGAALAREEKP